MAHIFLFYTILLCSFSASAQDELLEKFNRVKTETLSFYAKFFQVSFDDNADILFKLKKISEKIKSNDAWEGSYAPFRKNFEEVKGHYDLSSIGHELTPETPTQLEFILDFFLGEHEFFWHWERFDSAKEKKLKDVIIKVVVTKLTEKFKDKDPNLFRDIVKILSLVESDFSPENFNILLEKSQFFNELNDSKKIIFKGNYGPLGFLRSLAEIDKLHNTRKSSQTYNHNLPKFNSSKKTAIKHLSEIIDDLRLGSFDGLYNFTHLDDGRINDFLRQLNEAYQLKYKGNPSSIKLEVPAVTLETVAVPSIGLSLAGWRLFSTWPSSLSEERKKEEINNFISYFTKSEKNYSAFLYWSFQLEAKDVAFVDEMGEKTSIREKLLIFWKRKNKNDEMLIPLWLQEKHWFLALSLYKICECLEKEDDVVPSISKSSSWEQKFNRPATGKSNANWQTKNTKKTKKHPTHPPEQAVPLLCHSEPVQLFDQSETVLEHQKALIVSAITNTMVDNAIAILSKNYGIDVAMLAKPTTGIGEEDIESPVPVSETVTSELPINIASANPETEYKEEQSALLRRYPFDWQNWDNNNYWYSLNVFQKTWWDQFSSRFKGFLKHNDFVILEEIFGKNSSSVVDLMASYSEARMLLFEVASKVADGLKNEKNIVESTEDCDTTEKSFSELHALRNIRLDDNFFDNVMSYFFAHHAYYEIGIHDEDPLLFESPWVADFKIALEKEHEKILLNIQRIKKLLEEIQKLNSELVSKY